MPRLEARHEQLLHLVVERYIETAEPVGSRFLVSAEGLEWSEATVRNDLRELEQAGFLMQPHTSAGRVPTTFGYRYYVRSLNLPAVKISKKEGVELEQAAKNSADFTGEAKQVARTLVELSSEMVLFAFSPEKVYYTGLASLFQKPDFGDQRLVVDVSTIFDSVEEVLGDFFASVSSEPKIFIGDEHPFGARLSVLSALCTEESLIALIGPERMNYKHNWALLQKVITLI